MCMPVTNEHSGIIMKVIYMARRGKVLPNFMYIYLDLINNTIHMLETDMYFAVIHTKY